MVTEEHGFMSRGMWAAVIAAMILLLAPYFGIFSSGSHDSLRDQVELRHTDAHQPASETIVGNQKSPTALHEVEELLDKK